MKWDWRDGFVIFRFDREPKRVIVQTREVEAGFRADCEVPWPVDEEGTLEQADFYFKSREFDQYEHVSSAWGEEHPIVPGKYIMAAVFDRSTADMMDGVSEPLKNLHEALLPFRHLNIERVTQ